MSINAFYNKEDDIIEVNADVYLTTETIMIAGKKAIEICKQYNCDYILFDVRKSKEAQSLMKGFLTMSDMRTNIGFNIHHKMAVIYNPETYSTERAKFIENVVVTRPNPAYRMFQTKEDAIKWLKELKEAL